MPAFRIAGGNEPCQPPQMPHKPPANCPPLRRKPVSTKKRIEKLRKAADG